MFVLLAVYLLTLAPDATLWDSAELITAIHTLGIPHPPGTPLFVAIGRVWTLVLAPFGVAQAANMLSAVATAAACGMLASLMARWSGRAVAALAAGISAGVGSTVWLNATETEVYAVALLLAAAMLLAADRAGREDDLRWTVLVAYLFSLAVPLHLFALVAAPGAIALASTDRTGRWRGRRGLSLSAVLLGITAVGTARLPLLVAAGAAVAALDMYRRFQGDRDVHGRRSFVLTRLLLIAALGLSALAVLIIRARFDPFLNEGNPSSIAALIDVVARRQYSVASLWPRQAPLWLQFGNLLQYADWQFALALAPGPLPDWGRTVVTTLFAILGLVGASSHRRLDRRSWRALVLFMATATVGVVLYLNLRAGPTIGHGLLAEGAPHEARERDYFFVFAFWLWGAWAGFGAVTAARHLRELVGRGTGGIGAGLPGPAATVAVAVIVVASAIVLNWSAVDRRRGADATIALDVGRALLDASPPRAIVLTAGDLDSYPMWYLQAVQGMREDVTVVVVPMLPAGWYRAELARRHQLLPSAERGRWEGEEAAVEQITEAARRQGRPVAASALLGAGTLGAVGGDWAAAGVVNLRIDHGRRSGDGRTPPALGTASLDGVTAARTVNLVRRQLPRSGPLPPSTNPAARRMRSFLECARLVADGAGPGADSTVRFLLDSRCNLP